MAWRGSIIIESNGVAKAGGENIENNVKSGNMK